MKADTKHFSITLVEKLENENTLLQIRDLYNLLISVDLKIASKLLSSEKRILPTDNIIALDTILQDNDMIYNKIPTIIELNDGRLFWLYKGLFANVTDIKQNSNLGGTTEFLSSCLLEDKKDLCLNNLQYRYRTKLNRFNSNVRIISVKNQDDLLNTIDLYLTINS